jgi:hypothetical protein
MGPTLTLISLENGRRLAAYAQHSWDGNKRSYIKGDKNVLYSFNEKKSRISKTHRQHGQYSNMGYGPTFGGGHDFCMYADMTKVAYCNSHSFAGPATNVDVCGGGGKVVHLEVYALGEARRHPNHAKPTFSIHLIYMCRRVWVGYIIVPITSIMLTPDLCSGLRHRLRGRVAAPRAAPAPRATALAPLALAPAAPAAHAGSQRGCKQHCHRGRIQLHHRNRQHR